MDKKQLSKWLDVKTDADGDCRAAQPAARNDKTEKEGTARRAPTGNTCTGSKCQGDRQPIRCFDGNAEPHQPFWQVVDLEGQEPELDFFGTISEYSWFEDDITPGIFKDDLYRVGKGGPITIKINSYGGDVVAASMIHNFIRDYPGVVTTQIEGIAASAATMVALAGDRVKIRENAYFMIHDPAVVFFLAQLNIEDLTRLSNSLQAVKEGIINAYESKTGLSRDRLAKLMTEETWMDANKAMTFGFVDELVQDGAKALQLPANVAVVNALQNYAHVPAAVMEALQSVDVNPTEGVESSTPLMTDDMKREAQTLRERVSTILERSTKNA